MHSYYWKYEVIKNLPIFSRNYFQIKCHQSLPVVDGFKLFSEYTFKVIGNHKKNDPTFFAKSQSVKVCAC